MGCRSYETDRDNDAYFHFGEDSGYSCLCTFNWKVYGKEDIRSLALLGAAVAMRLTGNNAGAFAYAYPSDIPVETRAAIADALGLPLEPERNEEEW